MNYNKISDIILKKIPEKPVTGIIFGSGLGVGISALKVIIRIPYIDIPSHPHSSARGHTGEWVFGYIDGQPIICANGRFHYYEGISLEETIATVLIIHSLGCKKLIITNAAGSLNSKWELGDFMFIEGYIDYSFLTNTEIPQIKKLKKRNHLFNKIKKITTNLQINLRKGIYTWTLGPSYETYSEIQDIISLGGNAVGMSTAPELKKALELDMDVIGLSCLTNYGAGIIDLSINHNQIMEITNQAQSKFSRLIKNII